MKSEKNKLIFGQNLRRLMNERRIKVSHLSRETKIPKTTLHDWMHGGIPRNVVALKKIADYFSMTIDEICFGDFIPDLQKLKIDVLGAKTKEELNIGSFDVILLRRSRQI